MDSTSCNIGFLGDTYRKNLFIVMNFEIVHFHELFCALNVLIQFEKTFSIKIFTIITT